MEPIASLTLICDLMPSSLRIRRVTIPSTAISKTLLPLTAADACFVDRSAALSTPEQQAHIRQQAAQAEPTLVLCLSIIQGLDLAGVGPGGASLVKVLMDGKEAATPLFDYTFTRLR
eukprot:3588589-Rhodomonas_salina.12